MSATSCSSPYSLSNRSAVCTDLETAEMDYEAVKSLYYDKQLIDNFDAAIVSPRESLRQTASDAPSRL